MIEEKQAEELGFKKLLALLAICVVGAEAAAFLMAVFLGVGYGLFSPLMSEDVAYCVYWAINDISVYVAPMLIYGYFHKKCFFKGGNPYHFEWYHVIPMFLAAQTLSTAASYLSDLLEYALRPVFGTEGLRDVFEDVMPENAVQTAAMFVAVVIVGPVFEELLFRKMLLRPLRRYGDMQAIIITSLLFGFFHGNLTQFLYAAAGGFILGTVAVRANSVIPSIAVHMMINFENLVRSQLYDLADGGKLPFGEEVITAYFWVSVAVGLVALIIMAKRGFFKIENGNEHLTSSERARIVALNPFVLIMTAILIVITVTG